jgi:tRNA (guanine-N7-)-methyltransferase
MKAAEKYLRFAGRRKGRPLHEGRAHALQAVSDFMIPMEIMDKTAIDPKSFFDNPPQKLWIEIGFGNGEHLIGQALQNPDVSFIGCEPFINGVSAAAKDIVQQDLKNIRLWPDEALAFLEKFPDQCADRIFLLFSDPWPKTKQYKRRVIQPETVNLFARLVKKGGEVRLATDHVDLAEWMLLHMVPHESFIWKNFMTGEWTTAPGDWVETRYQQKAAQQGRHAHFMDFIKI